MIALLIVAAALVILLVVVATRPADFAITRSVTINAPAATLFPYANSIKGWLKWSPFEKMDPEAKHTFFGPESGVGSGYAWEGNKQIGAGRYTITDNRPDQQVTLRLEFIRPFAATNTVEFFLVPSGMGTTFTWRMAGRYNFMMKALTLVMPTEKMVGPMFAEGLANLKTVVEKS